jgi:hypothetical protein
MSNRTSKPPVKVPAKKAPAQPEQLLTTPLSHATTIKPPNWTALDVLRYLGYCS